MDDTLKPHRDLEAEGRLKTLIRKIQSLMYEPGNDAVIETLLKEAAGSIKVPDRALDLEAIESYESWTDLDGFAGELTMEVPVLPAVSEEDFISIVQLIRETIETGQAPDDIPLNYFMDFYRAFFALNFPDASEDLFDEIFEDTPFNQLVDMAFPQP